MARGSFRDMVKAISPKWLQTGIAEKVFYTCGLGLDLTMQKLNEAMRMHIPTYGDISALPFMGADRGISQGPAESNATYALRLRGAYDAQRRAGSARAIAQQVRGYLSPFTPTIRTVDRSGNWYTYASSMDPALVPPSVTHGVVPNFDSLGGPYAPRTGANDATGWEWWNFWLIIYSTAPNAWASASPAWGASGSTWGDATKSWGTNKPQAYFDGLRALMQQWKAQHMWCRGIIVVLGAENTVLDPTGTVGTDGSWGFWGKKSGNTFIASRNTTCRFIDGSNVINLKTPFTSTSAPTDQLLPR